MASPTKTNELSPQLYITRLDYARTHGWWVRITNARRKPGGPRLAVSRVFSDGRWGGEQKALKAAREWRDEMLVKYPRPRGYRHRGRVAPGHGYLRFVMRIYYRRDATPKEYPAWTGWLRIEDGGKRESNASIERWGEKGARRRIEAWLETERRALAKRLGVSYTRLIAQAERLLPL